MAIAFRERNLLELHKRQLLTCNSSKWYNV